MTDADAAPDSTRAPTRPGTRGGLTTRAEDFPRWYQEVVARAELADNGPVRGTMVIRPWGYEIWERLQAAIDERIKAAGAHNAYFPLFIPEAFMRLEAEHVEGFDPELWVVTHGGGRQLEEPVVVRPTSETVINHFFAKWIQSYRDLPLLVNQWCNVVRWELRPRLFLRTTEFLWQEGHTAHADEADARAYALRILTDVYRDAIEEVAGIPVLVGHKTARERFAGAVRTWTCEAMMGDGKALQMGTSHELGQNFAKAFGIQYSDATGALRHVWQTSWGASTRLIGALIMAHGDDFGLRLPPALAPLEVVVLCVREDDAVYKAASALSEELRRGGHRVHLDARTDTGFGRRTVDWELKGVPVRVEVGPRDLAEGNVTVVARHLRKKETVALAGVADAVERICRGAGRELRDEALAFREARTATVGSMTEALEAGSAGFARVPWHEVGESGELQLAAQALTVRCLQRGDGSLAAAGEPDDALVAVVGRSY
ncbi:MAG: proline--tRNA ligase [Actinomycetota bacterium]|nr:proline--tRNA ligase [Actinomycetota bacterium]